MKRSNDGATQVRLSFSWSHENVGTPYDAFQNRKSELVTAARVAEKYGAVRTACRARGNRYSPNVARAASRYLAEHRELTVSVVSVAYQRITPKARTRRDRTS